MSVFYFAYGSNCWQTQMKKRCPSARKLSNAVLHGYRLTFTGYSWGWGGATATIVPDADGKVFGVVYEIRDKADTHALDAYEGFPAVHDCREFLTRLPHGQKLRAWAYVKREAKVASPSENYVRTISVGLKEHGQSEKELLAAVVRAIKTEEERTGRTIGWPPKIQTVVRESKAVQLPAGFGASVASSTGTTPPEPKNPPEIPPGFRLPEGFMLAWVLTDGKWVERLVRGRPVKQTEKPRPKPSTPTGTRPRFAVDGSDW